MIEQLSVAVLAGGASSRMGRNKALLDVGGERLVERVVGRLAPLSDDLMVSTNTPAEYGFLSGRVRFVSDLLGPGQGPLVGIASVLAAARHPRVLVVATDMPFLNLDLLRYLATVEPDADVVVPVIAGDGFPETMHAIYGKGALPAIQAQLASGRRKITAFFSQVRVRLVLREEIEPLDPHLLSFFNANTPADWEAVERLHGAP